jgi:hypothetical protein
MTSGRETTGSTPRAQATTAPAPNAEVRDRLGEADGERRHEGGREDRHDQPQCLPPRRAVRPGADVDEVAAVELELEQPATARTDRATAPETPASRRTRVRRSVLFMDPSLRTRGIPKVSSS